MSQPKHTPWIYVRSEPKLWTVGFYDPAGRFQPESDHASPDAAASRVALLNGGVRTASDVTALKALRAIVLEYLKDDMQCDHAVGLCGCHIVRAVEEADLDIAKAEGHAPCPHSFGLQVDHKKCADCAKAEGRAGA